MNISLQIGPFLNRAGLAIGFFGAVLIARSMKVGVLSKSGSVILTGLDPMESSEENVNRVLSSHWRNRFLTPLGWCLLSISFALQFVATFIQI